MRLGSADEPFRWYISHPAKWGPLTFQSLRLPSEVRMNAPLRVPTSTRTVFMNFPPMRLNPSFDPKICRIPSTRPVLVVNRLVQRSPKVEKNVRPTGGSPHVLRQQNARKVF